MEDLMIHCKNEKYAISLDNIIRNVKKDNRSGKYFSLYTPYGAEIVWVNEDKVTIEVNNIIALLDAIMLPVITKIALHKLKITLIPSNNCLKDDRKEYTTIILYKGIFYKCDPNGFATIMSEYDARIKGLINF